MPRTKQRGFTLVELLTVVAIIGIVMAFAATYMRPNQSERCKSGARALLGMAHEARQTAITTRQSTRIKLMTLGSNLTAYAISMETRDPVTTNQWNPLGGTLRLSNGVQVCAAATSTIIGTTSSPTCPLAANQNICYSPTGAVSVVPGTTDCDDNSTYGNGATLYLRTSDGANRFKLMIWGLTGLPKLVDAW